MALRHFGIYRDVTPDQAKLDKTAIKYLFRWGSQQESVLSGRCHVRLVEPAWIESMERLIAYNLIEYFDRRQSKHIRLTDGGQEWGMDLTCEATQEEFDAGVKRQAERVRTQDFNYTK